MKVKKIVIYPVKGLPGISLNSANVGVNGLQHDRIYMIADKDGNLVSQRTTIFLTQLSLRREIDSWVVAYKDSNIHIKDGEFGEREIQVEVWESRFICNEVSAEHSKWFSKVLGMECTLVVMPSLDTRLKTFNKAPFETTLSFADGYPISTLGTASLQKLNNTLSESIQANRFRSNIFIETETAHEEDLWEDFYIGKEVKLRNIKPCVRCEVITINQTTGVKGKEPIKTLATYRKFDNGVCFGSNAITLQGGVIRVGDEINILA